MTTPLSQFPKPEAGQYLGKRKLFLVPMFAFAPGAPEEGERLLERYWSEVRDHINNLERSLGTVSHVYHETLYSDGDEGLRLLEGLNPKGYSFVQAMCQSTAKLEATEDRALLEESMDWQRCLSIGLVSEKVSDMALKGSQEATKNRFECIASKIDETLKEDEAGVLFVREDHRIQFPADIQVFYVAPPALGALKRWIDDQVRSAAQRAAQSEEPQKPDDKVEEPQESEGQPEPPEEPEAREAPEESE